MAIMKLLAKQSFRVKKYYLCAFKETNIMRLYMAFAGTVLLMGCGLYYLDKSSDRSEELLPAVEEPPGQIDVIYLPGDVCDVTFTKPLTQEAIGSYINKCRENRPTRINIAHLSN